MQVKCPYCNQDENTTPICQSCGAELSWVEQLYTKSEYYYNKAYHYATLRQLSLAIPCLEKAISFNKYNVKAKNLLGLIYFEIGETASALKLWILSSALDKEDKQAMTYMEALQNRPKKLEAYKDSLILYNRALRYLEKKNDDMAVIRLKKAIHLNPQFLEARNLLALCYLYQKQEDKALKQLQYVLKKDTTNEKALYYLGKIQSQQGGLEGFEQDCIGMPHINDLDISRAIQPQKIIQRSRLFTRCMVYFILGCLCMFGIETALIIPNKIAILDKKVYDITAENTSLKVEFDTFMEESKTKEKDLDTTNQKLIKDQATLQALYNVTLQENRLWQAQNLASLYEWQEAAEILNNVATKDLDTEKQALYETLKEKVYVKAGEAFYKEGVKLYKEGKNVEATLQFEKCVLFMPGTKTAAASIYTIGQIEEENNNQDKALQLYGIILSEYQETSYYNKAKERMQSIEKNKE